MDLATFETLLTPAGQGALAVAADLAPTEESLLRCLTALGKRFPPELARAATQTVMLRQRAAAKFTRAERMYFTRPGLEMASGERVSRYRAARYAPFARVADLCCGIGGDSIGLAALTAVLAVDCDPLHLALAGANLAAYDSRAELIERDLTQTGPPDAEALFFDPGRRDAGRRIHSVHDYHPPLALIDGWLARPLGVKVSPGVQLRELAGYDCEIEFISVGGDLKEAVLWFGPLKTGPRRATLLGAGAAAISLVAPDPAPSIPPPGPPLAYLYEPDPAILRAGLVTTLAAALGARQLDADIAYLAADTLVPTPFARAFAIEADLPFSQKRLRALLRAMNVGQVTIKKRGSPIDVADFARSLKLKGDEERILFLTHVQGKAWVLIGQAVDPAAGF